MISHERHKRGIATVPLLSGVLFIYAQKMALQLFNTILTFIIFLFSENSRECEGKGSLQNNAVGLPAVYKVPKQKCLHEQTRTCTQANVF